MNTKIYAFFVSGLLAVSSGVHAKVFDEASLIEAIESANNDKTVSKIIFEKNAVILLTAPIIFKGNQKLSVLGQGAIIDGSEAGSFAISNQLTATTEDGCLIFNTGKAITIKNLTVINSGSRGIVVNVPEASEGADVKVRLHNVTIQNSALYGLHIDDNADEFDDGFAGSDIGVDLRITASNIIGNGIGAIDFDGIRIDERGKGNIKAVINDTRIDGNGGDGIELDEAGVGNVDASMSSVTINGNGFYDKTDLDDGFDVDEAGEGSLFVSLVRVDINNNMDEGLDLDESDEGEVIVKLNNLSALHNADEGIKIDEEGEGSIVVKMVKNIAANNGDDGVQITESGNGWIDVQLTNVSAKHNAESGVKVEQWLFKNQIEVTEPPGSIRTKNLLLLGNNRGDELELQNVAAQ